MRKTICRSIAIALLLLAPVTRASFSVEIPTEPRLETYVSEDGSGYFALSLVPQAVVSQSAPCNAVIVFDTSASQASGVREKGLQALSTLLSGLRRSDRVQLVAADLEVVPLTAGFVPAAGDEMKQAIAGLKKRAPLGATDMPQLLRAAAASLVQSKLAGAKAVVYIGDGVSAANFMDTAAYRKLIGELVDAKVPVSSYGIGPNIDSQLLASLANLTGGMLAIDSDSVDPKQAGAFLASAVQGTVLWPRDVVWPKDFAEVYPEKMPPLRSDRDTIVVGKGKPSSEVKISVNGTIGDQSKSLGWTVSTKPPTADYAFLRPLVDGAHEDGGLRLITVGTPGLNETRRIMEEGTQALARLAGQALSTGNLESAERLANEALRRDPNDETAAAVKQQVAKARAGKSLVADEDNDERPKLKRTVNEQATPPTRAEAAKYRKPTTADEAERPLVDEGQGQLLEDVDQQRRLVTAQVRAEVENELREARGRMRSDPASVQQGLKLLLERVVRTPQLSSEVRAQLRGQLETALREAHRQAATKDIIDQQEQEARTAALDRLRIAEGLVRNEEKTKQLMDRFTSLMDEGRYAEADRIGSIEMPQVAPDTPIAATAELVAHQSGAHADNLEYRNARMKGVVDTLRPVELALIPFPDDQPVVYPAADVWQELTYRRKKYTFVDLKRVGPAERRIQEELKSETTIDFQETPLQGVVDYLKDLHGIEIQLDDKALSDAGVDPETQVTKSLKGISLRSALKLLLSQYELTYIIKDEVLLITTTEKASTELVTKAYPVADLVIPITSGRMGMGGMGMMGGMGGMMGGGMGGMGGGMGGMGGGMMGGMGGMGGGMGGMGGGMGGMGGGMFSVVDVGPKSGVRTVAAADDLRLGPKKNANKQSPRTPPKPSEPAAKSSAKPAATAGTTPAKAKPVPAAAPGDKAEAKPQVIKLSAPSTDPEAAWSDYFAAHANVKPQDVRETVRQLKNQRQWNEIIGLINAAVRNGLPQPWMYEALALAIQASGGSKQDLERALMSGLDFADGTEDFMYVAQYMARSGLESRALKVFRQVSMIEPLRPEPYLYGLQLAQRAGDLDGIRWSSLGILKQAWPRDKAEVVQSATRAANAALADLKAANRASEAAEFEAELDKAKVRDCVVKVTWTGDADVDVVVEEPTGSTCSFRNPRTIGGGVLLGDAAGRDGRKASEGLSETYVCPEAFSGTYRVLIRRVWGKITAGKVTVEVFSKYGSKDEKHLKHQIPLGDEDQLVVFELQDGRRTQSIAEQQLANAAAAQGAVNQAIVAQQIAGLSDSAANASMGASRQSMFDLVPFVAGAIPVVGAGAVGYQPIIITLPNGASMTVSGVVSADRRYVRVTPFPLFSGVSSVTTFNIQSGSTSTSAGPGAGGTQPGQTPPGGNPGGGAF